MSWFGGSDNDKKRNGRGQILIYRGDEGTGNREQEWRLPRTFRYCTSCSGTKGLTSCRPKGLTSCRGNLPPPFPADKNAVAADCRRYRAFRDSILHFRCGNVPFVLAATFRARLFLFPVDCSLFPLYYPLLFHQQRDKSVFPRLNGCNKTTFFALQSLTLCEECYFWAVRRYYSSRFLFSL